MGYIVLQNLEVTVREYIIQVHHQVVYFLWSVAYLGAQMNEFIYLLEISGEGEEPRQMFIVLNRGHPIVFCKLNTTEYINMFWCEGLKYCVYWHIYSTRSPFVTVLSWRAQSGRWSSYREMGVVHWITFSSSDFLFLLMFYLFILFLI